MPRPTPSSRRGWRSSRQVPISAPLAVGEEYRLEGAERLATPALLIYAEQVDRNIAATIRLLDGDAARWRPHLKTAKLDWTMRRIAESGVKQAKCATTLELETACRAGFEDVLLAYAVTGPHIERVRTLAEAFPRVRISSLVESAEAAAEWRGTGAGLFVDVNIGMNRTGAPLDAYGIEAVIRAIRAAGVEWRGIHAYDGQAYGYAPGEGGERTRAGYDALLGAVLALRKQGLDAPEIITAGTPAFRYAVGYRRLLDAGFVHTFSPGTVVYNDFKSLEQLPADAGYRPAVLVLARVVSHPLATRITCDAGHKSVSADAGDPTCAVIEHADWVPGHPSEEHLPVDLPEGTPLPDRGSLLQLLPHHVCPTVNNFDHAVIVENGRIERIEAVTARGHAAPF